MNQQPAPLISTLLTTRTFLLEYVIGGGLTLFLHQSSLELVNNG